MSFNKITMVGNLGKDPELRELASGRTVCNFNVAVSEPSDRNQGATWFRVSVWGQRALVCADNLRKGSAVYVAGRLKSKLWEDSSGEKHVSLEVRASDVRFFGLPNSKSVRVA